MSQTNGGVTIDWSGLFGAISAAVNTVVEYLSQNIQVIIQIAVVTLMAGLALRYGKRIIRGVVGMFRDLVEL
ncbi:MAG: hypothetical protein QXQ91_04645 [Nanopusillaceae archaeon]